MKNRNHRKYFFLALLVLLIILSFKIILPFINAVLTAIVLAFVFYPLFKKLNKKIKNKKITSYVMLIILIILILIPAIFAANILLKEVFNIYSSIRSIDEAEISNAISSVIGSRIDVSTYISEARSEITNIITGTIPEFLLSIPRKLFSLFVILFTFFYVLKDKENLLETLKRVLPVDNKHKEEVIKEFAVVTKSVIFGLIVAGIAQGIAGAIGFKIFGISNALFWGVVMATMSILPIVGPFLIWVPAGIYLLFTGNVINGILLLIYGTIIISSVDNVIKPRLISSKIKIHPIIVLLGLVGGIKMFGLVGVIIGPLILALTITFFKFYEEKNVIKS